MIYAGGSISYGYGASLRFIGVQGMREHGARLEYFLARAPVLKALGFSDSTVLWLVVGEAGLLCTVAAPLGLGAAAALPVAGQNNRPREDVMVVLAGILAAALVVFASAIAPALRARRLSVVDALAEH